VIKMVLIASFVLVTACATSHPVAAPVSVVVMAEGADRADAARLQRFVEDAIRHSGATARGVVTVKYYGPANAIALPARDVRRGSPDQLVFAAFTITDGDGNVLHSEWLPYLPSQDHLKALHATADLIARRVR